MYAPKAVLLVMENLGSLMDVYRTRQRLDVAERCSPGRIR